MDRRDFLTTTFGTPVVFGLTHALTAVLPQDPHTPRGDHLGPARTAMRERHAPGIAIIVRNTTVPATGAIEREQRELARRLEERFDRILQITTKGLLGDGGVTAQCGVNDPWKTQADRTTLALHCLLLTDDSALRETLCEAVWLVATPEQVGARDNETVVLVDQNARRVSGAVIDLVDESAFRDTVIFLLRGGNCLADRARRGMDDRVAAALAALQSADVAKRENARKALLSRFRANLPMLLMARQESEGRNRERIASVITEGVATILGQRREGVLPFGAKWEEQPIDYCPPCGMSQVQGPTARMLRLLTANKTVR